MSKYGEMTALLEFAAKMNKPEKPKRWRRDKDDAVDIVDLLQKERRKAKVLDEVLKDIEKLNKKEDKGPTTWWAKKSIAERTVILSFIGPPVGIGYVFCLMLAVKALAQVVGMH